MMVGEKFLGKHSTSFSLFLGFSYVLYLISFFEYIQLLICSSIFSLGFVAHISQDHPQASNGCRGANQISFGFSSHSSFGFKVSSFLQFLTKVCM